MLKKKKSKKRLIASCCNCSYLLFLFLRFNNFKKKLTQDKICKTQKLVNLQTVFLKSLTETYAGPLQTSNIERFAAIVNYYKSLIIVSKLSTFTGVLAMSLLIFGFFMPNLLLTLWLSHKIKFKTTFLGKRC